MHSRSARLAFRVAAPARPRTRKLALAMLALATLAVVVAPRTADACTCNESTTPIAVPAPDTIVPPNPTLYVFVPRTAYFDEGDARARINGAGSMRRLVATSPALQVWRFDVLLTSGSFELDLGYVVRYTIGATPPNRAYVVGVGQTGTLGEPVWCSAHVAIDLETTGTAIAYRFAWRDGTTTILPVFRSQYSQTASSALGLLGCDEGRWNVDGLDK